MSRNRDFREPRRRGFDDDFAPPRDRGFGGDRPFSSPSSSSSFSAPAPSGPPIDATVKWFNPEKGFGFVELADGSGDVFLHARALEAAGQESVPPGSKLSVRVGQGQKGRQVTEVLEVDTSTAEAAPARRSFGAGPGAGGGFGGAPRAGGAGPRAATGPTEERVGTVKWYNPDKGFRLHRGGRRRQGRVRARHRHLAFRPHRPGRRPARGGAGGPGSQGS